MTVSQTVRLLVLRVVPVLWAVWALFAFVLQRQFLRVLKTNHPGLWASLGNPTAPTLIPPWFQLRYSYWFWTGGFDRSGDTKLAHLGTRFYAACFILVVTLGAWAIVAWLCGYIELR
jgi:hypothetical protein